MSAQGDGKPLRDPNVPPVRHRDLWWDDDGCWGEVNGELLGPFACETDAERAYDAASEENDQERGDR